MDTDTMTRGMEAGSALPSYEESVQKLSGSYRETILLLAQGHSYQDMAQLQESTIGMVASRVRRARHMLYKALKQAGYNHREER